MSTMMPGKPCHHGPAKVLGGIYLPLSTDMLDPGIELIFGVIVAYWSAQTIKPIGPRGPKWQIRIEPKMRRDDASTSILRQEPEALRDDEIRNRQEKCQHMQCSVGQGTRSSSQLFKTKIRQAALGTVQ